MSEPSSGTADEVLHLPSGGGAVAGIGSTVDVDLNTGTASAVLDLHLPTGPNAIRPEMTLRYHSGAGDGSFGPGWTLGLLTITRKLEPAPASRAQDFTLVGVADLLAMGDGRYRPAVDSTHHLIVRSGDGWSVTDSADTTHLLGTGPAARIAPGGGGAAAWLLERTTDSQGHAVTYTWLADGDARHLSQVDWGTHRLVLRFEPRPDRLLDGRYGAPVVTSLRCSSVELHATTEAASLVRSWALGYDDGAGTGRSLLTSIAQTGHEADGSTLAAPVTTLRYSRPAAPTLQVVVGGAVRLADPDTALVDLDGDGLPDVLHLGAGYPVAYPNLGGGRLGPPRPLSRVPAPAALSARGVAFADMTGDGSADLLVLDRPVSGYYPLTAPPGGSGPTSFGRPVRFARAPGVALGDRSVRVVDLDNDGVSDLLVDTGRDLVGWLRNDGGWSDVPRVVPAGRRPPVSLGDARVHLADMTGDGITDIVRVDGGGVTYWPGRADGGWGDAVRMTPAPDLGRAHEPSRLALVDVDGDGCADLVLVGPSQVTVWRNVGMDRLAPPVTTPGTPPAVPGSYRLVDLLGNGTPGVLFDLPAVRPGPPRQAFLDLSGGVKPYLLTGIDNGAGLRTELTYRASTAFAADDAAAGSPWRTFHPFPVQCVARLDVHDDGSGTVASTVNRYHEARYDPAARAFLGFGRVDSDRLGDATSPTMRTTTTYHLGLDPTDPARPLPADEALRLGALRRRPLTTTVLGLDGSDAQDRPYSVVRNTFDTHVLPAADGRSIVVPYQTSAVEERYERAEAVVSTRTVEYLEVTPDGDVTRQRTRAQRAGQPEPDQDVTTVTTFATGGTNLRLPARITQTGPDGGVVAATRTIYDGAAHVGLPEGQATAGLVTRIEDLAFDDATLAAVWGAELPDLAAYGYHRVGAEPGWWMTRRSHERTSTATGPLLVTRGPRGGEQRMQLDAAGENVVAVTDAMGNTRTAVTDPRTAQTASLTDPNGHTLTDVFDALGRVVATVGPGDTPATPGVRFAYAVGPVSTVVATHVVGGGEPDSVTTTWLDASGRTLGQAAPSVDGVHLVLSKGTGYDARGLADAAYLPYEVPAGPFAPPADDSPAVRTTFDALGRALAQERPDGLTVRTARAGSTITTSEQRGVVVDEVEQDEYDATGQLVAVRRNAGDHWVEQRYRYHVSGAIAAVTLPDATEVLLQCDLMGRRLAHTSPDSGTTRYLVDATGNERVRVLATGQRVVTEVDLLDRVTSVSHDGEPTPRVTYDYYDTGGAAPPDGTANRAGRCWRVRDELGEVVLGYDDYGRTTSTRRTVAADGSVYETDAEFDRLGRTTAVVLPGSGPGGTGPRRRVEYGFGADGRVRSATGIVTDASYDLFGRLARLDQANGTSTEYSYLPAGGPVQRVVVRGPGGAVLRDTTALYDGGLMSSLTSAVADEDDVAFGYDPLRRLASATYTGAAPPSTQQWAYDDAFRLLSATGDGGAGALTYVAGRHQLDTVGGQGYTYDAAGRVTAAPYGTLAFDAEDRLAGAQAGGHVIEHVYDFQGRRALTRTDGAVTYLCPSDHVEVRAGTPVVWLRFGRLQVAADVGGELVFLHRSALGVSDLFTLADGTVGHRARVGPYLGARAGGPAPVGAAAVLVALLTGVDEAGLLCLGHRWYDPRVAQFVSTDPIVTSAYTVGAWHPYLYCLGNPVALADPTGAGFWDVVGMIALAVLVALLVVAAVWTCGATLVAAGVLVANVSTGLLVATAIGAFGGALAGELSAQRAGGDILAGALLGGVLGGVCALTGGALGAVAGNAIGATSLAGYVVSGAIQGAIAGAGTGLATGYAGGKGTAEQMLESMGRAAAWGASLGALLGLGSWGLFSPNAAGVSDNYLAVGGFGKYDFAAATAQGTGATVNTVDNTLGLANDAIEPLIRGPQLADLGDVSDFITTTHIAGDAAFVTGHGALLNIYIGWVPSAAVSSGGFADVVVASIALDQAGYSYADQLAVLLKAAPYFIDLALTLYSEMDPSDFTSDQAWLNKAFGSAEAATT